MSRKKPPQRKVVTLLDEIPAFASEEEEREWWATHDVAEALGEDGTAEHPDLIRKLKAKYRYMLVKHRARGPL